MPKHLVPHGNPVANWGPVHDMIISLHVMGYSRDAIASLTDRSPGHITRVIQDPRGKKAIEVIRKRSYKALAASVEERMMVLGRKALENIAQTIDMDVIDDNGNIPVGSKAKVHQDNVSFELLKRIGFGAKSDDAEAGGLRLSPEGEKKFLEGIDRARQAQAEYEKAEVVVVPEGGGNGKGD
jgi:hypothetical protein